jgi:protein SCO1
MQVRVLGRWGAALALALAGLMAVAACGGDETAQGDAAVAELHGLVRNPPLSVGEVTLPEVDASGTATPFAFRAEPGRVLVTYFGYTNCPDLCPTTMADLRLAKAEMDQALADRIDVAFATVDPERDTPDTVGAYLSSFFPSNTHPLRTEDPEELQAALDAFLATASVGLSEDGRVEVSHTGITYVIDATGTVRVEWPFGVSAEAMAADLSAILAATPDTGAADADTAAEAAAAPGLPLSFSQAWARTSPAGADNGAAYLTITSNESVDDRIIGVAVDPAVASMAELHSTTTGAGGAMTMGPAGEPVVPAGGSLVFEPGGIHVMLMDLQRPLRSGDRFALTLTFAEAGAQQISVVVKDQP